MKKTVEEAAIEYSVEMAEICKNTDVYFSDTDMLFCKKDFQAGAKFAQEQMFEFVNWAGKYFIRLEQVWVGHYVDQRDKANWLTTEQLFERWEKLTDEERY
jgi:hypothetical protein